MLNSSYRLARNLFFRIDAEKAHHFALSLLRYIDRSGLAHWLPRPISAPRMVMGLPFANAVGLAAGFDKDGATVDGLARLGFGFIEVGTITPRPQPGNPPPRLFRLPQAEALVNRMGFNNGGVASLLANLRTARWRGVLGINIGKNADTPLSRAADDYLYCFEQVYPVASYVTLNISSPNTQNLRQLQSKAALDALLAALKNRQARLADQHAKHVPLAVKIAPDLDQEQIKSIAGALLRHRIEGVIATNTTLSRTAVMGLPQAQQSGGLSGRPLFEASTEVIRILRAELGDAVPIIGVGGILSARDAREKLAAGASLVQLYSGLIYRGPALVRECAQALAACP